MKTSVIVAVYNEEKNISELVVSLISQSVLPHEVIIVDDGSTDNTPDMVKSVNSPLIKYIRIQNSGPAAARNVGWRVSESDICIFTDGDCLPEREWIETLLTPFNNKDVGAAGGTYKTLNIDSTLARFIGFEIAWKYKAVEGEVDAHGSYNLAVRKKVLEEIGGFNEEYRKPSGEDWDLTYKISRICKIIYVPDAVVGHFHPESLWSYLKNQTQRSFDRIKLYKDHPDKKGGDTYTGNIIKYQILLSGAFIPSLAFIYPLFSYSFILPLSIFLFLMGTTLIPFSYIAKGDPQAALYGIPVQLLRNFAWAVGLIKGVLKFGI